MSVEVNLNNHIQVYMANNYYQNNKQD